MQALESEVVTLRPQAARAKELEGKLEQLALTMRSYQQVGNEKLASLYQKKKGLQTWVQKAHMILTRYRDDLAHNGELLSLLSSIEPVLKATASTPKKAVVAK